MTQAELLKLLQCPDNKTPLKPAEASLIAGLNARIEAGQLTNRSGAPVKTALDGGLVRADGKVLYPIQDGIPILIKDEAILLD